MARLEGGSARAGRQDHRLSPATEARILRITREERPPAPLTHWTSRRLAARVAREVPGAASGYVELRRKDFRLRKLRVNRRRSQGRLGRQLWGRFRRREQCR